MRGLGVPIGNSVKFLILAVLFAAPCVAQDVAPDVAPDASVERIQKWNIHGQITETPQGDPPFPALYSGPNSLDSHGEIQETFTSDLYAGVRLWHGGEIHVDALLWQGFGLSNDKGIEAFPNGDAFKLGTKTPYFMFAHLFIRQTIGFGGKQEPVPDGPLTLAGEQDISRLTFTLGRFSPHGHVRQQRLCSGLAHSVPELGHDHQPCVGLSRRTASGTPRGLPWN